MFISYLRYYAFKQYSQPTETKWETQYCVAEQEIIYQVSWQNLCQMQTNQFKGHQYLTCTAY